MAENDLTFAKDLDLSLFFYSSLDFMCIACSDGYFKKLNPAFVSASGYSEAEFLERPFLSFFHPDDELKTSEEAKKLAEGLLTVQFENRFVCKDGTIKMLSWKCTPVGSLFFATGRDISQRHLAEIALKESESRQRLILQNAPIALFAFDSTGLITFSSGLALKKMGITTEEVVGKNLFDIHSDRQDIINLVRRALNGESLTSTIEINGLILETSYAPIRSDLGVVEKVIGVSVDVTESRNAALAAQEIKSSLIARELEKQFKETFEHAGIGIAHSSFEGKILLVNQELCSLLGYTEQELHGANYFNIITPNDVATPEDVRRDMLTGKINKYVRERTLRKKNGDTLCVLVTATAVRDTQGVPKYFILAHKDITEMKAYENAIRASEENFRSLAEAIPQIVWTSDALGNVNYFNQKWYSYTGMSEVEAGKSSWLSALHPDDVKACYSKWYDSISQGHAYENQRRFKDVSGNYRWHLGRAVPIRDASGKIIKWFGTCTDIHDQKVAEVEKQNALIGEKVAKENARVKTEFLATMSHEIRTPLNSVIGMSEILLDTRLDSDQYEYAETIKNSGEALLAIVNDVLDLSKIEAGHLVIERIDFDLKKLIRDVQQESSWVVNQKGIDFNVLVSSDVPAFVNGDMTRIRQILSNLVSNAIKFTHEGTVMLKVEVLSKTTSVATIRFEVEDTGIGISEANIKNLFQAFNQVDSSTTRKYGGTGLGLSICKKMVELLSGEIGVKSQVNKGSSFFFSIPFALITKNSESFSQDMLAASNWTRIPHVLIVEDLPINHKVLTLFLNKLGCSSRVVENGIDAIDLLSRESFDLVLMDCQMPGLDGYQTSRAIRKSASPRVKNVPIIATTASAVSGDRERCIEAGMSDYLSKPMRLVDLKKAIATCLDSSFFQSGKDQNSSGLYTSGSKPFESNDNDAIDWKLIDEINESQSPSEGNVSEIIKLFKSNLPKRLQELKMALDRQDVMSTTRESHAIKSSSSYIGARQVSKICDGIKTAASKGDFLEGQRLNELLLMELKIAIQALERRFYC